MSDSCVNNSILIHKQLMCKVLDILAQDITDQIASYEYDQFNSAYIVCQQQLFLECILE